MRKLDHVVMPFAALAQARGWFESLGFIVAPDAAHPFGTGNACVFFADGLFIEPLARVDEEVCQMADRDGNLFVRKDAAFRADHSGAYSALALASSDAMADRESLALKGLAEEATVDFERTLTMGDGTTGELKFRLAFVKDFAPSAPSLFLCEQRHQLSLDRSALTGHRNTAIGIAGVTFATIDPEAAEAYLAGVFDGEAGESEDGDLQFDLPNGFVTLAEVGGDGVPAFALIEILVHVTDINQTQAVLKQNAIDFEPEDGSLAVSCPNGAGRIVFVEK